ncbi:phage integrase SAM-like domain and Arm DNA-binding domain-containing protein [Dysgonomonas reticulitermitis]
MRSTFKVLFYLKKNNLNRDGEAPIMARITIDGTDIALIELAPAFITGFELYLATVPKLAHNTIWLYMMPLRRMISIAINNRWLTYDPFSGYEIAAEETDAGYLDKDEIRAIMDAPLKKRLELVRDLFFSSFFPNCSQSAVTFPTNISSRNSSSLNVFSSIVIVLINILFF